MIKPLNNSNLKVKPIELAFYLVIMFLAACTSTPDKKSIPSAPVELPSSPIKLPADNTKRISIPETKEQSYLANPPVIIKENRNNSVIDSLLKKAQQSINQKKYEQAMNYLERGISIAPSNPVLWQKMASVHLVEGRYAQAEQFATKSNVLNHQDEELRFENKQIIAAAKKAIEARKNIQ